MFVHVKERVTLKCIYLIYFFYVRPSMVITIFVLPIKGAQVQYIEVQFCSNAGKFSIYRLIIVGIKRPTTLQTQAKSWQIFS
jgi:hypothetical protein